MNCSRTEVSFFALLEIKYCDLGVCLSQNGSLDMVWGAFHLVPPLIPGRPFCPCVMSQVTLMGKAFGQDWGLAMGK